MGVRFEPGATGRGPASGSRLGRVGARPPSPLPNHVTACAMRHVQCARTALTASFSSRSFRHSASGPIVKSSAEMPGKSGCGCGCGCGGGGRAFAHTAWESELPQGLARLPAGPKGTRWADSEVVRASLDGGSLDRLRCAETLDGGRCTKVTLGGGRRAEVWRKESRRGQGRGGAGRAGG